MVEVSTYLALDVGDVRIGVAIANNVARLPRALPTLRNGPEIVNELAQLVHTQAVSKVVIGLPRGMNGQDTDQTQKVRRFAEQLRENLPVGIHLQDEAATSIQAEAELQQRKKAYTKEEIDARAAVIILDDFLREQKI